MERDESTRTEIQARFVETLYTSLDEELGVSLPLNDAPALFICRAYTGCAPSQCAKR